MRREVRFQRPSLLMAAPTGAALALVTRFAHGLRRGSLRSMARYRSMLASLVGNISTLKAPYDRISTLVAPYTKVMARYKLPVTR